MSVQIPPQSASGAEGRSARSRAIIALLLASVVVGACSKSSSTSTSPSSTGAVASITVSPSLAPLTLGDTLRFSAVAYDANGNLVTTAALTWKSTDSTVATVSDSGLVTAKDTGSTTVTATSGAISGTATVTVKLPLTTAMASVSAVSAGFSHSCGLVAGGVAYCWGSNAYGQLGVDSTAQSVFPQPVSGGFAFASLALGYSHSCGLTAAGAAYCWGDNESGELGNATSGTTSSTPVPVAGGLAFAVLSAGYSHTCGVTTAGAAYCWGANESGELGNGAVGQDSPTPVLVSGGLTFASISAGGVATCGITTSGAAYCWGSNAYGALGDGTTTDRATPVAVAGGLDLAAISAGVSHACGVTTSGAAYCWGDAANGQLGNGVTSLSSSVPVAVAGGHTFAQITTGEIHTCALTPAGIAYCWGDGGFGDLGTGSTAGSNTPVPVSGGLTFSSVSAGLSFHTCARTPSGNAYCWGYNDSGELGNAIPGGYSVTPQEVVVPTH